MATLVSNARSKLLYTKLDQMYALFKRNNESYNAVTILVITTSGLVIFAPQERGAYRSDHSTFPLKL